ncbi:MAG: hypothetical protein IJW44_01270, partial [Clostridia bacterium]|nr:hypothetical protein [Clostridia bacterium]
MMSCFHTSHGLILLAFFYFIVSHEKENCYSICDRMFQDCDVLEQNKKASNAEASLAFLARRKGFGLACGLGHFAALTAHRAVIHYRSAFESLPSWEAKKQAMQKHHLLFWHAVRDSV